MDETPLAFLVAGFISILALLAYGINSDHYLTYNLLYQDIFSNPEKYRNTALEIILVSPVLEIFSKVFSKSRWVFDVFENCFTGKRARHLLFFVKNT